MKCESKMHNDRLVIGAQVRSSRQITQRKNYELDSKHLPGMAKRNVGATPIDSHARSAVSSGAGVLHLPTQLAGAVI